MSEEVSELFEVLQSLVRDHHVGAVAPIQWGGAVWGSLVAGAVLVLPDDPVKRSPIHLATGSAARPQVPQLLGILELLGLLRGDRLQLA
eukprot:4664306-Pyramimonas_sp.AAC.1